MNLTAIGIIAIICWTIVKLTGKDKKTVKQQPIKDQEKAELQQQIQTLKERIAVLEAIVTDDKYTLNREFDNLSRNRAA
jgi:Holliday junction resolvasome RuvABC endonuclease subunit